MSGVITDVRQFGVIIAIDADNVQWLSQFSGCRTPIGIQGRINVLLRDIAREMDENLPPPEVEPLIMREEV